MYIYIDNHLFGDKIPSGTLPKKSGQILSIIMGDVCMRTLIHNTVENCTGCNRCVRVCPIEEANPTYERDGRIIVEADSKKCIACGQCIDACHHGARQYSDDTERFFDSLYAGTPISMFAAPAMKTNFGQWGSLLTWLRKMGVRKIYDVSLGADICTWAHIRHIQKNGARPLISQPCPAIVNYILMHRNELMKHLSPVHSPMLCTAIYMKKYEQVSTEIAALSPCIAKTHEFEDTGLVEYNVTFKNLSDYIERNNITLPNTQSGFDSFDAGLGTLYPMPGGLKECVEHYLGKAIRIEKSEGTQMVYKALDLYSAKPESKLPVIFDVLNCMEGCNIGTGCSHDGKDIFDIKSTMSEYREAYIGEEKEKYLDGLFSEFGKKLRLADFLRIYVPKPVYPVKATEEKIEVAFTELGKTDSALRQYDCGACGCDSCYDMAVRIAKGINTPKNCIEKMHQDVMRDHDEAKANMGHFEIVLKDTQNIKSLTEEIVIKTEEIGEVILSYNTMIGDIEKIAMSVGIIALNASVEAARLGVHGKAFAVVADEIKKLAQRSDVSAKRTKDASQKAASAVTSITTLVTEISKNVNDSYGRINVVVESSRKILSD